MTVKPVVYNGDELFSAKMKYEPSGKNIIHGLTFSWDNTYRHGARGYIITSVSKNKLFDYLDAISDEKYLFINAWNEWCEGMILEPTEKNGLKYLEWLKEWTLKNDK